MDTLAIREIFTRLFARFDAASPKLEVLTIPAHEKQVALIREGYKVETLPKGRAPIPTRLHVFDDIEAMSEFIRRHWPNDTTVEVFLTTEGLFEAARDASWGSDRISCALAPHLTAKRWSDVFGRSWEQRKAYQTLYALRKTFDAGKVLAGLMSLEVKGATGFQGVLNERGVYVLKGQTAEKSVVCEIPSSLTVRMSIFRGQTDEYDVEVDIGLDVEGAKPIFNLSPTNLDEVRQLAIEERTAKLLELLNEGDRHYQVYRGSLKLSE